MSKSPGTSSRKRSSKSGDARRERQWNRARAISLLAMPDLDYLYEQIEQAAPKTVHSVSSLEEAHRSCSWGQMSSRQQDEFDSRRATTSMITVVVELPVDLKQLIGPQITAQLEDCGKELLEAAKKLSDFGDYEFRSLDLIRQLASGRLDVEFDGVADVRLLDRAGNEVPIPELMI